MKVSFLGREVLSLQAAALILGGAAFLSRILGLFRDRLLAARFGAGDTLDAYYGAFQIPDIIFTIFLIGAASAAVLPIFLEYEKRSREEAEKFISNLLTAFSFVSLAIAAAAIWQAPFLVGLVVPGFSGVKLALAVSIARLVMLNAVFFAAAGILSSVLQAHRRFFVFALPPVVYNFCIIFGILFLEPLYGITGVAWGVLAGGFFQVVIMFPALGALNFRLRPSFDFLDKGLIRVVKLSFPRVLALSMSQLTLAALGAAATFFAAGSLAVFRLASNLMYVPVGLFGVSYALAIFPKLSGASLEGQGSRFGEQVNLGIRNILFWAAPLATLFIVLRAHIVRVVLGSGAFDWQDTRLVAAALAILAVAVISESILPLVLRAFYALGKTKSPLLWDVVGSALTVLLAFFLIKLFSARPEALRGIAAVLRVGDLASPGVIAVALAFAAGSLVNILLLLRSLQRTVRGSFDGAFSYEADAIISFFGAALLCGVAAHVALLPFPVIFPTTTFWGIFSQGAIAGIVGLSVYWVVLAWQKNPEILTIIASLRRRLLNVRETPQVYDAEKFDGDAMK